MGDTTRCEPEEALRGVDGDHWVTVGGGKPEVGRWVAGGEKSSVAGWWLSGNRRPFSAEWIAQDEGEVRWLCAVTLPDEVAALREELAAWRRLPEAMDLAPGADIKWATQKARALIWVETTLDQTNAALRADVDRLRRAMLRTADATKDPESAAYLRHSAAPAPTP